MAFTRNTRIIFFAIAAVVVIGGILIYIFRCKLFPSLSSCVEDPNKNNIPVPPGSPTPKWVPESFPLNVGMFGPKIKALQKALGFQSTDKNAPNYQDGYFGGEETKSAIIAKGKTVPLSEADYNSIVNPAASGGGSNFQQIKTALAGGSTNFNGGISYLVAGQNKNYRFDFYTNGRFFVNTINTNDALRKGTYSNGGKKMVIDGGATYENSVVANMTNIINEIGG